LNKRYTLFPFALKRLNIGKISNYSPGNQSKQSILGANELCSMWRLVLGRTVDDQSLEVYQPLNNENTASFSAFNSEYKCWMAVQRVDNHLRCFLGSAEKLHSRKIISRKK